MAERYSKLFLTEENLYITGAPLLVLAGALLKDDRSGNILAQLKFKNIQDKNIKAVYVALTLYDSEDRMLADGVAYQYLDLDIARDQSFGQQVPLILKNKMARHFTVAVTKVLFQDGTQWIHEAAVWRPLKGPLTAQQYFGDEGLAEQYHIKYGANCDHIFGAEDDLWYCICGEINHQDEPVCHRCQRSAAHWAALDMEALREELEHARDVRSRGIRKRLRDKRVWVVGIALVLVLCVAGAGALSDSDDGSSYSYSGDASDGYMDDDLYEQIAVNALYSEIMDRFPDADAGSSKYSVNKIEHLGLNTHVYGQLYLYDKYGDLTSGYSSGSGDYSRSFEVTIDEDGDAISCVID